MTTESFTTSFGAIPRPEEPERPGWAPTPVQTVPQPSRDIHPMYSPFSAAGPQANASVINNIRIGGRYRRRRCNHAFHAVMTVFTGGLWSPVWLIAWLIQR